MYPASSDLETRNHCSRSGYPNDTLCTTGTWVALIRAFLFACPDGQGTYSGFGFHASHLYYSYPSNLVSELLC